MSQDKPSPDASALLAQREASVKFGRKALQTNDLDSILTEACRLTAEALQTDFSKIMKLESDGCTLLVVAGVGWRDGIVGEERIPVIQQSSEGFALRTGLPAVSNDIEEEDRFDYAEFLQQHDVQAMINVIIPGPDGKPPYGLLQVDNKEPRDFSQSDLEFLQSYANLVGAAIERNYYQEELSKALKKQERLYAELNHRVRNSLMVMRGLMQRKATRAAHPVSKQDIAELLTQIDALNTVYDQLYANSNIDQVDLGGYLAAICANVVNFHSTEQAPVRVETSHEAVSVRHELAVNLGLVTTEFVTNSVKHAAPENGLQIRSTLCVEQGHLVLNLSDNGVGLGDALGKKDHEATGEGLSLIEGLLKQMDGEWKWGGDDGTSLHIRIQIDSTVAEARLH